MRNLAWLLLLAVALALVHHVTAAAPLEARAALGLGVVVVAAELAGRLAARWRLPRVSGFVLAGILLRPDRMGAVRADEVAALQFVGAAALALFALRAGLAWRGSDAPESGGLGRVLASSLAVPFLVTAAAVWALHPWFPLTRHQPMGDVVVVALALGAFTGVAAPALTWATLGDVPSGRMGDEVLRLHALRDIAVVPLFAAVLALGRVLADPGTLQPSAFVPPLVALAASVAAGALLAALVVRFRGRGGVFLLAVAFGAALAARAGAADVTLAGLVAGIGLARFAGPTAAALRERFDVHASALAAGAFGLLGAQLDTTALLELWPWVVLLALLRALGLYWGGRWAARGPLATDDLARSGWPGLIGQAGVGLLLAAAGRRAFPEWGVSFESLAVALVALHAVVGPVCLRRALARRPVLTEGVLGGT